MGGNQAKSQPSKPGCKVQIKDDYIKFIRRE